MWNMDCRLARKWLVPVEPRQGLPFSPLVCLLIRLRIYPWALKSQ